MTTPKEILDRMRELAEERFWFQDREIDNSGSTSTEYYIEAREKNSDQWNKDQDMLYDLEELLSSHNYI